MKRNASIELWRCFCMLAVVCSHVVVNNGVGSFTGWMWHVPGFLLITAFFGIKFRWIKVLKLLGVCYGCYWLTIPLRGGAIDSVDLVLPHGGWFVPFYIVLMILSPILNAAIASGDHKQMALIVGALLLFAWCPCFCPRLGMMRIAGMQGSGMLLMISIYLLARLAAEHSLLHKVNRFVGGGLFLLLNVVSVLVYSRYPEAGSYVSPLSIAAAFCGFSFVANIKLPKWLERVVCFVAPSMFGVYLLHECCLKSWQYSDFAAHSYGHALVWACCLFFACVMLDMIRRFVLSALKMLGGRFWNCVHKL